MNDKTLGEYKRTTPDPDETTGEALARLQAELTRLLDEADAELRDEADGGVAAALIEQEAEARATTCTDKDAHWRLDEALETIERLTRERDEARGALRARLGVLAESRPLTPDAITDEMRKRAREAFFNEWDRADSTLSSVINAALTAALTEPPARPEGAEEIEAIIADQIGGDVGPATIRDLADRIAAEDGAR